MPDDAPAARGSNGLRCPWCSAELTSAGLATCPSCGAKLQSDGEPQVPGLTAIDPVAVLQGSREPRRPRNRLIAWLSGEDAEEPLATGRPEALAPPEPAVRREMLRLQMEAELSELSAEAEAIVSDQAIEAAAAGDATTAQADVQAVRDADAAADAPIDPSEGHEAASPGPAGQDPDAAPAAGTTPTDAAKT